MAPRDIRSELLGLDDEARAVRRAAFQAVLDGQSLELQALADQAKTSPARVEQLRARGLLTLNEAGLLVGAAGLSLVAVPGRPHRLMLGDRAWWTWCAVDVVGIPAALRTDAVAETACAWCAAAVRVLYRNGEVAGVSHPEARLWLADHVEGRSVVDGTCGVMNLFCTSEHLEAWRGANRTEPGRALTVAEAAEIGREVWGSLLDEVATPREGCCS